MKRKVFLQVRDMSILHFLWRWKVSTTAYIHVLFFGKQKPKTAYLRMYKLKNAGYIRLYFTSDGKQKFWGVTRKGFNRIKTDIPDLLRDDCLTESPSHDMQANTVMIGIFDTISNQNVRLITEQELNCQSKEGLPVKLNSFSHKPDGLWVVDGKNVIALEMEISSKTRGAYTNLAYTYDAEDIIKCVLWVTDNHATALRIYNEMARIAGKEVMKHSFIFYKDFVKDNAKCAVIGGFFKGKTLTELFEFYGADRAKTSGKHVLTKALMRHKIRCW